MSAYVDVRGAWPILVIGPFAISLEGLPRNVSVEDALAAYRAVMKAATEER